MSAPAISGDDLNMLRERGVDIARVVVHDADDRLVGAARRRIAVVVQADPKLVTAQRLRRTPT